MAEQKSNTAPFQEILQLQQKQADLRTMLDGDGSLAPEVRSLSERGIAAIGDQIIQIVGTQDFQGGLIDYGQTVTKNLEALSSLEGLVPQEELDAQRSNFLERLSVIREFISQHGERLSDSVRTQLEVSIGEVAVAGVEPEIPPQEPTVEAEEESTPPESEAPPKEPPSEEEKEPKIPLTLIIRDGLVQIGKRGKAIQLSNEARQALGFLVAQQGKMHSGNAIREVLGIQSMKRDKFSSTVTHPLGALTYRRQHIVKKEGRTKGTKYGIDPRFEVTLEYAEVKPAKEKELLDKGDVYTAVRHLINFNPLLKNNEIPPIDESLLEKFEGFVPDYSIKVSGLKGEIRSKAVRAERQAALARTLAFMEDEERFFAYLDTVEENQDDPTYDFVKYLFDLEEEQREVLKQVMKVVEVYREDHPNGYYMVGVDERDKPVARTRFITDRAPTPLEELVIDGDEPTDTSSHTADTHAQASEPPRTAEIPVYYKEAEMPKRSRLSRKNRERLDSIRAATKELVTTFLEHYSPDKTYKRTQLQSHFSTLKTRVVANAAENNVGPSERRGHVHREFDIHDVVNILLYNNPKLRDIYTSTSLKKQVAYVILQTIEQKVAERKAQTENA